MKLLFFLLFSFSIMSCSKPNDQVTPPQESNDSLGTGWKKIPIGTSENVLDIFFINNSMGYLVAGNFIYRSTDGGNNWQKVYRSRGIIVNIAMGDENNAIFNAGGGGSNLIILTRDGGVSFDSVSLTDNYIFDAFFVSSTVAYAVGEKIWKTTNAGVNWTSYSSLNYSPGQYYQSLHFINEQTGWVTGNGLLKTSNGGNTWENLPLAGLGQSLRYPGSVFFPDASTGYISSTDSLAKTIDGGNTWNKIFKTYHSGLHDLHFVSPQSGYAGDGRYIMKTINGGQTWTKDVALKRENNLMELHFTNASHGWACGTLGLVLKYEQ